VAASFSVLIHPMSASLESGGVRRPCCVRHEVADGSLGLATQGEVDMLFSLKRFIAVAGITCAIAGVAPVAMASAATAPAVTPVALPALPALPGLPALPLPFPGSLGLSCSVNQGFFPGFLNLGPTGPLGPLGPHGPLGNTNNNLPCGADVFNLGPSGPLGPGGALGTLGG
jgi:hypothetical protein